MNAIEVKNLCKSYKDFKLDNLTFSLPGGCILGLIGENGAGKSTTIKLLLDMIRSDGGSVKLLGKNNVENINLLKEDIGVVLDEVGISGCLNALEVGKIMGYTYKNWQMQTYSDYLNKLGLPEKKQFKEYSRGMKMKLGIAVALSHNAKLLILDEPTSGLDPVVRDEVVDIFNDFTRDEEHSILISSHIVSDLEKLCDYIAFLHKGKLLLFEEKDVLTEEYVIMSISPQDLSKLDQALIAGKRETPYGVEVLMKRSGALENAPMRNVGIEELFIFMVKEECK